MFINNNTVHIFYVACILGIEMSVVIVWYNGRGISFYAFGFS